MVAAIGAHAEPFPMYDPLPPTGVAWLSADPALSMLLKHGETSEEGNGHVFYAPQPPLPEPFTVLVEGAQYIGAWLETQPMAGAMWATRSVRLGLDNQLVFMRTQRSDGRLSHRVDCGQHKAKACDPNASLPAAGPEPVYLQGLYMASPAVDVAWFMSCQPDCGNLSASSATQARAYLVEVAGSLARYDAYLWATRNDSSCAGLRSGAINLTSCPPMPSDDSPGNSRGLLWSVGSGLGFGQHGSDGDSGEDGTDKYINNTGPIQKMDMMGYSFDLRRSLARIAALLGNDTAANHWSRAAALVQKRTIANLWRPDHSAMYDRDATDSWVTTLVHNNLRMMWLGLFTQQMADEFVHVHLMNTSEFWTPMPLPSISVSDPRYQNKGGNDWSGPTEGLTLQRSIRALEAYGHFAELTMVGRLLTRALLRGCAQSQDRSNSRQYKVTTHGSTTSSSPPPQKQPGCHFPQQIDPFTAIPSTTGNDDGYGPMILSLLEYTALRVGIMPRAELLPALLGLPHHHLHEVTEGGILWSGVVDEPSGVTPASEVYNQTLGDISYSLVADAAAFSGYVSRGSTDHVCVFKSCSEGVRVVSRAVGTGGSPPAVTAIVGIDSITHHHVSCTVCTTGGNVQVTIAAVRPNEVWTFPDGFSKPAVLHSSAPFTKPHA
jgi:hypothetical protein